MGELYGHHTLRQILVSHGIRSNKWSKVYKSLTLKQIEDSVSSVLRQVLKDELICLARKSESTWSRHEVTIVADDSIFKQWLSGEMNGVEKTLSEQFFAKYFSGQTQTTVYGFRVTLIGVCLGGTFYPYTFQLSSKADNTRQVVCEQLESIHKFLCSIARENELEYPNLFVSVDSGFDSIELLDKCDELSKKMPIIPICVPKKTNKIEVGGQQMTIQQAIDDGYIQLEKAEKEHFAFRVRVLLCKYNREVTLLLFRLNGSKKVSVIYTTDTNIKAKTLRRRWFQRTQIEQFFRLLKDTLKIQQSKVTNKEGFERKLWVFVFKALNCQLFRNYCRRRFRLLKGWAFTKLRQRITFEGLEKDWLYRILIDSDSPFA